MFGLGTTDLLLILLIVILLIVILLFGAGKLPQLGAGLAKGISNFRKTMKDDTPADKPVGEAEDQEGIGIQHARYWAI